jgi:lipopolysaccharide biosynthesis glycosyltransferase
MMFDNRKRKRVKRCSGANLLLVMKINEFTYTRARLLSHLILHYITVKGKWNHACMQKEMMRWCACEKKWNVNRIEQPVQLLFFRLHCCLLSTHTSIYIY